MPIATRKTRLIIHHYLDFPLFALRGPLDVVEMVLLTLQERNHFDESLCLGSSDLTLPRFHDDSVFRMRSNMVGVRI